ncbi:hypothetical protein [Streptomyces sp. NPDC050422]|uniref:hypothetical protein n=1 Tax=Streptomyces sp. NPDC050422 TaxID=3365614 RepID=UPI0037993331
MTGIEIAAGYVFAWALGKAKRVGRRADAEVDQALDVALDRLDGLVRGKLGADPALDRLTEEARSGLEEPSARTRQRVVLALEDVADAEPGFAEELEHAIRHVQALYRTAGGVSAGGEGTAVGGNVDIRADHGSVAAWSIRDVTLGTGSDETPPPPGPPQG